MKILIAEDDQFIREGLVDLLEAETYQCLACADGAQALETFMQQAPDLVLLDIMMPKMDGYSVCRAIRQSNLQVPIIFISAKTEEIDKVLGLELGADDYIMKPFGTREVIARIRAVTRRFLQASQPKTCADSFIMGDLTVFPTQLRAQRAEQTYDLSLRDVKILQLLYKQRGQVVDRDTLFNECWGRDYLASSRTLDQHVSKLRKLIEQDAKAPQIIHTVHGVGYRFI